MRYYPAFLDLKEKKCLVVGGGKVAERKINSLLRTGACVWVISPILTKGLIKLKKKKRILHKKSDYKKNFLRGAFLVIAATDNRWINSKVSFDAKSQGILVNIVDSPGLSNFIVPATLCKRDLIISISTSGKAPCLSKKIKEDLKKLIIPRYAKSLNLLKEIREELKLKFPNIKVRKSILNRLVNSKIIKKYSHDNRP